MDFTVFDFDDELPGFDDDTPDRPEWDTPKSPDPLTAQTFDSELPLSEAVEVEKEMERAKGDKETEKNDSEERESTSTAAENPRPRHTSTSNQHQNMVEKSSTSPKANNGKRQRDNSAENGTFAKKNRYDKTAEEKKAYNEYMKIRMRERAARLKSFGVKRVSDMTPEQKAANDAMLKVPKKAKGAIAQKNIRAATHGSAKPKNNRVSSTSRSSSVVPETNSFQCDTTPAAIANNFVRDSSIASKATENGRDRSDSRSPSPPSQWNNNVKAKTPFSVRGRTASASSSVLNMTKTGRGRYASRGTSTAASSRASSRSSTPAYIGGVIARKVVKNGRRGRPPGKKSAQTMSVQSFSDRGETTRAQSRAARDERAARRSASRGPSVGPASPAGSRAVSPALSSATSSAQSKARAERAQRRSVSRGFSVDLSSCANSREGTPRATTPVRNRSNGTQKKKRGRPRATRMRPTLSEAQKTKMREEDLEWLKDCGLHYPGKKYRLARKGTVYEFSMREYITEIDEGAHENEDHWETRMTELNGEYHDDFIVGCTAYEGIWDEAEESREVRFLSKYQDFPVAYWMDYESTEDRFRFSAIRAVQEWRWRETAISKARAEMRKECEAAGQDFDEMYPQVFLPEPGTSGIYSHDMICKRRTRLRALEATINDIVKRCGLPPVVLENWTGKYDSNDSIFHFIWTNYINPSTKVMRALQNCDRTLTHRCNSQCICNGSDSLPSTSAEKICNCQRSICEHKMEISAVECFDECGCSIDECPSRVIQRGRQHPVLIIRHPQKGWTIRALEKIPKDTFVGEYTGEILTAWENEQLEQNYSIEMPDVMVDMSKESNFPELEGRKANGRWKRGDEDEIRADDGYHHREFTNTALRKGNECRFASHHCLPNMRIECRYLERFDWAYHHFGFFTTKDVEIGQELTWNYHGERLEQARKEGKPFKSDVIPCCECGSGKDCMIQKWSKKDYEMEEKRKEEEPFLMDFERGYDSFSDDQDEMSEQERKRQAEVDRMNRLAKRGG